MHSQRSSELPTSQAKSYSETVTQSEMNRVAALFNTRYFAEMESVSRSLTQQYPNSGFAWKALGASLLAQGKDALYPLQRAATLLPRDPDSLGNLGNALRDHGRLDDSVANYRKALALKPDFAMAYCGLGIALSGLGLRDDAVASYRRAIALNPQYAEAHNNLGNALRDLDQPDLALASYQRALEIKPDFAEVYNNLGNALRDLGRLEDAVNNYRRALEIKPDFVEVYNNLGNTLRDLNRSDEAVASFVGALEINPNFAQAHNNLGVVLLTLGKFEDSAASCRRALLLKPDYADAHANLGNALRELGQLDEAVANYRQALALNPESATTYNGLGNVLWDSGHVGDAVASYRAALQIDPRFAMAFNNLGNALRDIGQLSEAAFNCNRALEINPDFAMAHNNLGNAFWDLGQLDKAMSSYRRALEIDQELAMAHSNLGNVLRDRRQFEDAVVSLRRALEIKPDYAEAYDNLLMTLQFLPGTTRQDLFDAHTGFGEKFESSLKALWSTHSNSRDPDKRLKIGYVSGDFRMHAVAYFIEPVIVNHDKSQVEVFCYSNNAKQDIVTERLIAAADHWQSCRGLSDDQLAQRIRADGIDILVDLAGHSAHNRLLVFARKPAPIQITYLGYPGTSGLSAMDYRLTDNYTEPEDGSGTGAERFYTERLLRLPDSIWCYRPNVDMPAITPLPALANGYLTFGSFNNFNKIDSECIALWAELLSNLPASRLLIATVPEGEMRERLTAQFNEHRIAANRIDFCGSLPPREFQRKLQLVDITLDPFPINGATTTCESLWLGVPVLTLVGESFLSRAGLSVLSAAQMPEFAAANPEDFIQKAISLANDIPKLANMRAHMRERLGGTALFDQTRFTRNLESIYRNIWRRYTLS